MNLSIVKQTVLEFTKYGRYLLQQRPLPPKRFVIFGRGRSGSTVLVSLLNSHSEIGCDGEILHNRVLFPRLYIDICATRRQSLTYGFKLLSYQVRDVQPIKKPKLFLMNLYNSDYKIIYLKRRNLLYHALSNINARQNKFHHHVGERKAERKLMRVEIDEVLHWIKHSEVLDNYEYSLLEHVPHHSLTYEDNLISSSSHQATVDRICELLNLTSEPVETDLIKLMPSKLSDMIENYEELTKALRATKYAAFLEAEIY